MYGITENGFIIKPRSVILEELNASHVATFGAHFDVTPESPDGQRIGILADAIYECWLRQELVYNNFTPSKSFGVGLDDLVSLNGITRITDKNTTVVLSFTGVSSTLIPAGSLFETSDGLQFSTNTAINLPDTVTATSLTAGAIAVDAGEVVVITEAISGVTTVTNAEKGVVGVVRQTDPELRVHRARNTISRGQSYTDAIVDSLTSLVGVTTAMVIDNDTSATLGTGQPPNSFNVVVEGGDALEIARRIFANKPIGIAAWGDVVDAVEDKQGNPHNIGFSRPANVNVEVNVNVYRDSTATADALDVVKSAVVDYINAMELGEDLQWSKLVPAIVSIQGVTVSSITTATQGGVHNSNTIVVPSSSKAKTNLSLVTVVG